MQADALTHQSGTIAASSDPVVLPLVIGAQYLLICGLDGDNFNGNGITPELFTGTNNGDKSQGVLNCSSAAEWPVGASFTIGETVYTAVAEGDQNKAGEFERSDTLTTLQANIVAAINGTDRFNDPHPDVTASAFGTPLANQSTIEAIVPGTDGNLIALADTVSAFQGFGPITLLGTLQAGTDDYDNETAALPQIGASDSDGSPILFEAEGMVYFDAGLPNLILQPNGEVTSVRYFLTKVGTMRGLLAQ